MRRVLSLVLAMAILLSLAIPGFAAEEETAGLTMSDAGVDMIKSFEGFSKVPYWDVNQWTVGYGTRCPTDKVDYYKENGITEEEAVALLRTYIASYEKAVNYFDDKYDRNLKQHEFDALVCFTYNLGSDWIYKSGNFRKTVSDPNSSAAAVIFWFGAYCSANGSVLSGLVKRRMAEANLYLNGEYGTSRPSNYCYVKLDANGGELKDSRINAYDINTTDRIDARVAYGDFTFEGWFTGRTSGTQVTFLDKSHHGDTLYAHWSGDDFKEPDEEENIDPVTVTVTSEDVNLRKGPGTNYTVIGTAVKGETLTITATKTNGSLLWGYYGDGWVSLKHTNFEDAKNGNTTLPEEPEDNSQKPVMGTVKVNSSLSVRAGAGTGYDKVDFLYNGDRVEILEQKQVGSVTWGRIKLGWISMEYVVLDEAEQTPDEPEQTPEEPEQTPDVTPEDPPVQTPEEPEQTPDNEPEQTPEEEPKEENTKVTGTVKVSSTLTIRKGPGTSYGSAGSYKNGAKVTITETKVVGSTTWGKTSKGWISMKYVVLDKVSQEKPESTPEETPKEENTKVTGAVKVSSTLTIRKGPGTSYGSAGSYKNGAKVTITETKVVGSTTWGKTSKGWISMKYVVLDKVSQEKPETTPEEKPESKPEVTPEETPKEENTKVTGTVKVSSTLTIRKGAGTSYSSVGSYKNGAKVTITETKVVGSTTWGKTSKGWISMKYVVLDNAPAVADVRTVTASCLKVRKAAGTGNTIVDYLYKGDKVEILETKTVSGTKWGRISTGWISLDYVK